LNNSIISRSDRLRFRTWTSRTYAAKSEVTPPSLSPDNFCADRECSWFFFSCLKNDTQPWARRSRSK